MAVARSGSLPRVVARCSRMAPARSTSCSASRLDWSWAGRLWVGRGVVGIGGGAREGGPVGRTLVSRGVASVGERHGVGNPSPSRARRLALRLGVHIGYWGLGMSSDDQLAVVQEAERLGFDSVWTAEAYGSDAATILAWLAGQTSKIRRGS